MEISLESILRERLGKNCTEVIENTRMDIVAKTKIPEINLPHRIMGQDMVVQRIPIEMNGELVAVLWSGNV